MGIEATGLLVTEVWFGGIVFGEGLFVCFIF